MPVSTENFWNIKKLNIAFLLTAALLFLGTQMFVVKDYWRNWRTYQRQARVWKTAMTHEAMLLVDTPTMHRKIAEVQAQIEKLQKELPQQELAELQRQIDEAVSEQNKRALKMAVVKGEIGPKIQILERSVLSLGKDHPDTVKVQVELAAIQANYDQKFAAMSTLTIQVGELSKTLRDKQLAVTNTQKKLSELTDLKAVLVEKLGKSDPQGLHKIDEIARNLPLLDWLNPSEKVQQVVIPDVLSDYHFVQMETIDRCNTCHVNIADPAFEPTALLSFVERQIAVTEGQDIDQLGNVKPVVLLDFWLQAAEHGSLQLSNATDAVAKQAMGRLNTLREEAGLETLESAEQVLAQLKKGITSTVDSKQYAQTRYYLDDLQGAIEKVLGKTEFGKLKDLYRQTAIAQYNAARSEQGLSQVSADPVLMGHPRMDLFVEVQSKHPINTMGCTVCHEGAGQETDFTHATHTPRNMWVDQATGTPIPDLLVGDRIGTAHTIAKMIRAGGEAQSHASEGDHDKSHGQYTHADLNLNNPENPAPFSPVHDPHGNTAAYRDPTSGELRPAVKQADFWGKKHNWHEVTYMHWEKPMHSLDYVESGCARCHTKIFDIQDAAPKLFEGRKLFAQLGCANCHGVEDLKEAKDTKQVGPSLVHVKNKLSSEMMASWIWAPKAFRPTTRMPHYFMLENNASSIDILRTRVEVAAITHYLQSTPTAKDAAPYTPQQAPEQTGDVEAGRQLFKTVGCMSCHANMTEFGDQWILEDLATNQGLSTPQAKERHQAMSYNQKHWYAMEHLEDKFSLVGPELSGVGTKLKADRTPEEARAWLFDWLRHPNHYSSYTIMPSFRLDDAEANDLAAYLLTLERPGYKTQDFMKLDDPSKQMLLKLVSSLKVGQMTIDASETLVSGSMNEQEQLAYLGGKMITHYGCNGCHAINGFEDAPSACANLDGWGVKDPHKIDFGYFDHAFDKQRTKPLSIQKVDHEGLQADAPQITANSDKIHEILVQWEHLPAARRPWLYQKLHNPRLFDRGRTSYDGKQDEQGKLDVGRPYDKLKMPKFFLKDREADALVTYVTSIRQPLVSQRMLDATYSPAAKRAAEGRQIATVYNCYGCHNIEGNDTTVGQFFDTHNPDGSFKQDNLNWAPPRLIGQGSKTQPDWLFSFMQNVQPIRPWLEIRMPSFPLDGHDASAVVDYFSGSTQLLGEDLAQILKPIDKFRANAPQAPWYEVLSLTSPVSKLRDFAVTADLTTQASLDPRTTDADTLKENWNAILAKVRTLTNVYQTSYPYTGHYWPKSNEMELVRGERLFTQMGCMAGACHRMGDEQILGDAGLLVGQPVASADDDEGDDDGYGDDDEGDDDGYGDDDEDGDDNFAMVSIAPQKAPEGAPNLMHVAGRLQHQWVRQWLEHAAAIQPGTRMQEFWPHGDSFFKPFPADMRQPKEAIFGQTGQQQKDLMLQFLYSAGPKRITYSTDGSRLGPGKSNASNIKLEALKVTAPTSDAPAANQPAPEEPKAAVIAKPQAVAPVAPKPVVLKSAIELHDGSIATDTQTRIVGVVSYEGKKSRRKKIRMSADPICAKYHKTTGIIPLREDFIVNKDGSFTNVFIHVIKGPVGSPTVPTKPAVLDQVGCVYHPHVMGVVAGQPVKILNSDPTLHNVKFTSKKNGKFNEGMPVKGMVINKVFSKPEMSMKLKCDVHAWMGGTIHVVDTPYFAVSDVQGRFEIRGLPPGQYTLKAVHENKRIAPVTFDVTVKPQTSIRADITLTR